MAINIIMMAQEPKVMITCLSSKGDSNRALSWYPETPFMATKIIMVGQKTKCDVNLSISKGGFRQNIKPVCKKCKRKRAPTKEKPGLRRASTGKMIATETRPRADRCGRCETLLPEPAWHLANCQRYATFKLDGSGKNINGMDLNSKWPRSIEVV